MVEIRHVRRAAHLNFLPHEVSLAIWLIGRPETVEIVAREAGPTELDRLELRLGFEDPGQSCFIAIDRISSTRSKTARIVTRSGVVYAWRDGEVFLEGSEGAQSRIAIPNEETLLGELRAFLVSVATGQPALSDGRFGARVVEAVERVARLIEPIGNARRTAAVSE